MTTITVDHTGLCMGYAFKASEPVDVPEEVVTALGEHATLSDGKEELQVKRVVKDKKAKNVKKVPYNIMMEGDQTPGVITKDETENV